MGLFNISTLAHRLPVEDEKGNKGLTSWRALTAPPELELCGAMDGLAMDPVPKLVLLVAIILDFAFLSISY